MKIPSPSSHGTRFDRRAVLSAIVLALSGPGVVTGQGERNPVPAAGGGSKPSAMEAFADVEARAERSAAELAAVRAAIDEEKIPLMNELDRLDDEQEQVRTEYERVLRIRDAGTLDVSNTKARIEARLRQNEYLDTQLDQFIREFESMLHVAELQYFGEEIEALRREIRAGTSIERAFESRVDMVVLALERLEQAAGGMRFEGRASDRDGILSDGTFVVLGARAYFAGDSDLHVGMADSRNDSIEPALMETPAELRPAIRAFVEKGEGPLPLDVTEGEAVKLAEAKETVADEIRKGGLVMYPLLGLGGLSLLIALIKWLQLAFVGRIGAKRLKRYLQSLDHRNPEGALSEVRSVRGPIGRLLKTGIEHRGEPRELVEEVLYEDVLKARQSLGSFIPFIKITAAAAPLLGLLGTVSGMINTFKLITIFGTGDASTFSSGISEALITTKWGLIVAIPCLLVAAFLNRKVKAVLDDMEKIALAIVNHLRGDDDDTDVEDEDAEGQAGTTKTSAQRITEGDDSSPSGRAAQPSRPAEGGAPA